MLRKCTCSSYPQTSLLTPASDATKRPGCTTEMPCPSSTCCWTPERGPSLRGLLLPPRMLKEAARSRRAGELRGTQHPSLPSSATQWPWGGTGEIPAAAGQGRTEGTVFLCGNEAVASEEGKDREQESLRARVCGKGARGDKTLRL